MSLESKVQLAGGGDRDAAPAVDEGGHHHLPGLLRLGHLRVPVLLGKAWYWAKGANGGHRQARVPQVTRLAWAEVVDPIGFGTTKRTTGHRAECFVNDSYFSRRRVANGPICPFLATFLAEK